MKLASPRKEIFPETVLMATVPSVVIPCLHKLPVKVPVSYPYPFIVIAPEDVPMDTAPLVPSIFVPKPMVYLPFTSPLISIEPAAVDMDEFLIKTP